MDFNAIYELVSPYLGAGGIAGVIIVILTLIVKVSGLIKEAKSSFSSTETEAITFLKKALPKDLTINIETLVKTELSKITTGITQAVEENFLSQIKANTELTQEIAKALCSMKAIPDSAKTKIVKLLDIKEPVTTNSLKVELLSVENSVEDNEKENKTVAPSETVLID